MWVASHDAHLDIWSKHEIASIVDLRCYGFSKGSRHQRATVQNSSWSGHFNSTSRGKS